MFLGYVLSREALSRFVNRALTDKSGVICKTKDDAGIKTYLVVIQNKKNNNEGIYYVKYPFQILIKVPKT